MKNSIGRTSVGTQKYYIFLLFVYCSLWALKDVLIKLALVTLTPVLFTFYVSIFGTVYSSLLLLKNNFLIPDAKLYPKTILKLGLMSLTSTLALLSVVSAIDLVGPVLYSLVDTSFYPTFVALFGYWLVRERISGARIYGLLIAVIGIIVFQFNDVSDFRLIFNPGILAALLSSLLFALSIILVKQLISSGVTPEGILFVRFLTTTVLLFIYLTSFGEFYLVNEIWIVALIALVGYTLPFLISFYVLREIPVTLFGIFTTSIPVLTFFFSLILLPQFILLPSHIYGSIIVLLGLITSLRFTR